MGMFYILLLFSIFMIFLTPADGTDDSTRQLDLRIITKETSRSSSPGPESLSAYTPGRLSYQFRKMRIPSPTNTRGMERYPNPRREIMIPLPPKEMKNAQYLSQMQQTIERMRSFTPRTNRARSPKRENDADTQSSPNTPGRTLVLDHDTIQSARRSLDIPRDEQISSSQRRSQKSKMRLINNDELMGIDDHGSKCVGRYIKFKNKGGVQVDDFFTLESLEEGRTPKLATILPHYVVRRHQKDIYERTEDNSEWQPITIKNSHGQRS